MSTGAITASTKTLYTAAIELDRTGLTTDERQAKQWIISSLEQRVPAVEAHMEAWADSDNRTGTYIQALGAALKAEGALR